MRRADEVRDHLDLVEIERLDGRFFQELRNGRYAVRLLQGVAGDRQVGAVRTDERDVRAVQCGDDGDVTFLLYRFAGEYPADRVRDGVMDVQKVKLFRTRDR